jgi:hypothetical protein
MLAGGAIAAHHAQELAWHNCASDNAPEVQLLSFEAAISGACIMNDILPCC